MVKKPCKENQIRNRVSGRCVNKDGKVGKEILKKIAAKASPKKVNSKIKSVKPKKYKQCSSDKIYNRISGRCVKKDGKIGKEILKKIVALKVSPKKVSPKKVSHKKVSPKKVSPKKVSPKKASPKKASPKKASPKKKINEYNTHEKLFNFFMEKNKVNITHENLPFKLDKKIGEGTYGIVFKVNYNGKSAVLKVNKDIFGMPREDELKEVYNSLYLSGHKYFPKVYKIFYKNNEDDETQFFMLSEYIQGKSLSDVIHNIKDDKKILDFRNQVLNILDWFCDNNVIHADFHPGNIIVTRNNALKVIDFGFAHTHNKCDRHIELVNLINYMYYYKVDKKFLDSFIQYYRDNYYKNDICFTTTLKNFTWIKKYDISALKNAAKGGQFSHEYFDLCTKFHLSTHKEYPITSFNYKKKSTFPIYSDDKELEVDLNDYKNFFEELN